jgi:hypothetical protein
MEERIMTLHPQGKAGSNISKEKYLLIRQTILDILRERGEVPFKELPVAVAEAVGDEFEGSVGWYTATIKLDLEARGEIMRVPDARPQSLKLGPNME